MKVENNYRKETRKSNNTLRLNNMLLKKPMESRKMVLKNLSSGQQWRDRHREQTCGHGVGGRGWNEWRE